MFFLTTLSTHFSVLNLFRAILDKHFITHWAIVQDGNRKLLLYFCIPTHLKLFGISKHLWQTI